MHNAVTAAEMVAHDAAVGLPGFTPVRPGSPTPDSVAYRATMTAAKAHFDGGGDVLVSERGHQATFPVGPFTTVHNRQTTTWKKLREEVAEWRNRYPNQRYYIVRATASETTEYPDVAAYPYAAVWSVSTTPGVGRAINPARRATFRTQPVTVLGTVNFEPSMVRVRTSAGTVARAMRDDITPRPPR